MHDIVRFWPTGLTVLFLMGLNPPKSLMQGKGVSSSILANYNMKPLVRETTYGVEHHSHCQNFLWVNAANSPSGFRSNI